MFLTARWLISNKRIDKIIVVVEGVGMIQVLTCWYIEPEEEEEEDRKRSISSWLAKHPSYFKWMYWGMSFQYWLFPLEENTSAKNWSKELSIMVLIIILLLLVWWGYQGKKE